MKKTAMILVLSGALGMTTAVQATLLTRSGGMVYDDVLNISWLADANYAKTSGYSHSADGRMTWDEAVTWANNLVYAGYSDWRLPSALNQDGTKPCVGYNCNSSEMGYMFYANLGGVEERPIWDYHNSNYSLFSNLQGFYWSGTEDTHDRSSAWVFSFGSGRQHLDGKDYLEGHAWAVRSGDVAAVPEPATMLLFGMGAMGFGLNRRWGWRRRS